MDLSRTTWEGTLNDRLSRLSWPMGVLIIESSFFFFKTWISLGGGGTISWAGGWAAGKEGREQSALVHCLLSAQDWGFSLSSCLLFLQPGFPHSDGRQLEIRPFSLKVLLLGDFLRVTRRKLRQYLRVSSAKLSTH